MVFPCCHLVIIGRGAVPSVGKGGGHDVLDQSIKLSLAPKFKVLGNVLLDVFCPHTAMLVAKNLG